MTEICQCSAKPSPMYFNYDQIFEKENTFPAKPVNLFSNIWFWHLLPWNCLDIACAKLAGFDKNSEAFFVPNKPEQMNMTIFRLVCHSGHGNFTNNISWPKHNILCKVVEVNCKEAFLNTSQYVINDLVSSKKWNNCFQLDLT